MSSSFVVFLAIAVVVLGSGIVHVTRGLKDIDVTVFCPLHNPTTNDHCKAKP